MSIGDAGNATPSNPLGIPGLGGTPLIPGLDIPGLNPQPMPPGGSTPSSSALDALDDQSYANACTPCITSKRNVALVGAVMRRSLIMGVVVGAVVGAGAVFLLKR